MYLHVSSCIENSSSHCCPFVILISTIKASCMNSTWLNEFMFNPEGFLGILWSWKHCIITFKSGIQVCVIGSQGCYCNGFSLSCASMTEALGNQCAVALNEVKGGCYHCREETKLNMYQSSYPLETQRRWMRQIWKRNARPLRFNHVQFLRHFQRSVNGQTIDAQWMKATWQCRRAHVA